MDDREADEARKRARWGRDRVGSGKFAAGGDAKRALKTPSVSDVWLPEWVRRDADCILQSHHPFAA